MDATIIPIESKLYMQGERLMLEWAGCVVPMTAGSGTFAVERNAGGIVDLTAHIETIVRRVMQPGSGSAGGQ